MLSDLSAVILAGGKSRRLGRDKTALRINGKTFLTRTVELLAGCCSEVIVVTNTPGVYTHPQARIVSDIYPDKGALGGLYTGLAAAARPYCIAVAADMPFLSCNLMSYLASLTPGYDVVIPASGKHVEPLHAIYGRACLAPMQRILLRSSAEPIISFFADVRVRKVTDEETASVDPDRLSMFNINTPDDLAYARILLRNQGLELEDGA